MCSVPKLQKIAESQKFRTSSGELYKAPVAPVPVEQLVPQIKAKTRIDDSWYNRLAGGPFNRSMTRSLFGGDI